LPEGDTLLRTARTLQRWLGGRVITQARSQRVGVPPAALVGQRVDAVEANGKHLLIRLSSGWTLHTHLRMTGSWHVYRAGERWKKPSHLARVVLEAEDRIAVCFEAPVVELLDAASERDHASLSRLGPDILDDDFDLDEIRRRARASPSETRIGELLLDQRVVAGIGNIYRCESLFRSRTDPFARVDSLDDAAFDAVILAASKLMRASSAARAWPWVYRRGGKPCRRCKGIVRSEPMGDPPRTLHWCPTCQARAG